MAQQPFGRRERVLEVCTNSPLSSDFNFSICEGRKKRVFRRTISASGKIRSKRGRYTQISVRVGVGGFSRFDWVAR